MQSRKKSFSIFNLILFIVMAFVVLICIVPFIYMIALSFSDPAAIMQNKVSFLPVGFTTAAYKQIFTYPNFFRAYGNTIFYTFFVLPRPLRIRFQRNFYEEPASS